MEIWQFAFFFFPPHHDLSYSFWNVLLQFALPNQTSHVSAFIWPLWCWCSVRADEHRNKELDWSADILGHFVHMKEKAASGLYPASDLLFQLLPYLSCLTAHFHSLKQSPIFTPILSDEMNSSYCGLVFIFFNSLSLFGFWFLVLFRRLYPHLSDFNFLLSLSVFPLFMCMRMLHLLLSRRLFQSEFFLFASSVRLFLFRPVSPVLILRSSCFPDFCPVASRLPSVFVFLFRDFIRLSSACLLWLAFWILDFSYQH